VAGVGGTGSRAAVLGKGSDCFMHYLLKRFEEALGAFLLIVMVTIAFLNVLTRYVFRYSMAFTEELTLYLFVWTKQRGSGLHF
jgi:C4-dicarboxylate transporter DctQ subunit